jgi:hypothetical protein
MILSCWRVFSLRLLWAKARSTRNRSAMLRQWLHRVKHIEYIKTTSWCSSDAHIKRLKKVSGCISTVSWQAWITFLDIMRSIAAVKLLQDAEACVLNQAWCPQYLVTLQSKLLQHAVKSVLKQAWCPPYLVTSLQSKLLQHAVKSVC